MLSECLYLFFYLRGENQTRGSIVSFLTFAWKNFYKLLTSLPDIARSIDLK